MKKIITAKYLILLFCIVGLGACKVPVISGKEESKSVPKAYHQSQDTLNSTSIKWRAYFSDPNLHAIIDTALLNNQELNITLQ
ncbi:MAG TPA: TolC family protein, partial [Daejeonella sp.]|nr:TolC family protein [Daejeonella sp.]